MRSPRQPLLMVESLESLLPLSTTFPTVGIPSPPAQTGAEVEVAKTAHIVHLTGSINGNFSTAIGLPDTGESQTLSATGTIKPLGSVTLSGSLQLPGFILNGKTHGTIQLQGTHGTVTITLVGPPSISPGGGPSTFNYHITAGTHHYTHAKGSGTLQLTEARLITPTPVGLPISPQPPYTYRFDLTFHPNH